MAIQLPLCKALRDGTQVEVDYMRPDEKETVRSLLNFFVEEGLSYPQERSLTEQEFAAYWMARDAFVVRPVNPKPDAGEQPPATILGAFYIKPNFPGRCSHICNAGFIVHPESRGMGIGRLMGETLLELAPPLGYAAIMFNLVFETNIPSLNLWRSLGFQELGRIPNAARLSNGARVDAVMLYREVGLPFPGKGG